MSQDLLCYPDGGLPAERVDEKVPMHPEDFEGLLRWVKAKEGRDPGRGRRN